MIQQIDGVAFEVKAPVDLRWLSAYGQVFHVFDQQDSGNLCFGVTGPFGKLFIKYAGAQTVNYLGRPQLAVDVLKYATQLYRHEHPSLVRMLAHGAVGEGYAIVFEWLDAVCLRPTPPDPRVQERLRRQTFIRRLTMLDGVFDLHALLAEKGIVAIDFYDGNLMLDFEMSRAVVCDIDLYRFAPTVNDRGRMQGSSRFMAPEEYALGAPLDACTNVYAMGALAFEFFGNNRDRSAQAWEGPASLYPIARRATADKRTDRYTTLDDFLSAWREAVRNTWLR